jgi:hypothetical protein
MNEQETAEATKAIGMMLRAFPSSQSNITADSAKIYIFAIEDMSLEAVKRACRALVRGEVDGRNHSFAPSAPELAQITKGFDQMVAVEQWESQREFVMVGSPLWRQLCALKKDSALPAFTRDGKAGWWFDKAVVAEAAQLQLPPPISEAQQAATRARITATLGTKFDLGDPDAEHGELGSRGAA